MPAGYRSLLAPWAGGASATEPVTQAGLRGLLAPWLGGAGSGVPVGPSAAGCRGLLGFWVGGAGAGPAVPPAPARASGGGRIRVKPRRPVVIDAPLPMAFDEQLREDDEALLLSGAL
jgi:hypothetical protein